MIFGSSHTQSEYRYAAKHKENLIKATSLHLMAAIVEHHEDAQAREGDEEEALECGVCADILNDGCPVHALPCAHTFHLECLQSYGEARGKHFEGLPCPTCKKIPNDLAKQGIQQRAEMRMLARGEPKARARGAMAGAQVVNVDPPVAADADPAVDADPPVADPPVAAPLLGEDPPAGQPNPPVADPPANPEDPPAGQPDPDSDDENLADLQDEPKPKRKRARLGQWRLDQQQARDALVEALQQGRPQANPDAQAPPADENAHEAPPAANAKAKSKAKAKAKSKGKAKAKAKGKAKAKAAAADDGEAEPAADAEESEPAANGEEAAEPAVPEELPNCLYCACQCEDPPRVKSIKRNEFLCNKCYSKQ